MNINNYKLIVVIVRKGKATRILSAARKAGAQSGTILMGKGTAKKNLYEKILGMEIEPEREIVLIAVEDTLTEEILKNVTKAGKLDKSGEGIAFVLNLKGCIGFSRLLESIQGGNENE
jgi:nitrogen regulatory protein PII